MKTEIKQYKKAASKIGRIESEINETAESISYKLFRRENERQEKLVKLRAELVKALDEESVSLAALSKAIENRQFANQEQKEFLTKLKIAG